MLNLSEKHLLIQKIGEKIAKEKVAPRAKEIDATGAFPWDLVDVFKNTGFLYLTLPERFGGLDGDITSLCLIIEELAKVSGASSLIPLANAVGLMPVMIAGSDEQKEYIYTKMTEPDKQLHLGLLPVRAGGGFGCLPHEDLRHEKRRLLLPERQESDDHERGGRAILLRLRGDQPVPAHPRHLRLLSREGLSRRHHRQERREDGHDRHRPERGDLR